MKTNLENVKAQGGSFTSWVKANHESIDNKTDTLEGSMATKISVHK
jgi:hypothetical protein